MSNQWRSIPFFERTILQDLETKKNLNIFNDFKPLFSSSGYGFIVFGGENGIVRYMNRQHMIVDFEAYARRLLGIKQLKRNNYIVTIGDDTNSNHDCCIKFWRINESSTDTIPSCVKTIRLFNMLSDSANSKNISKVTCFTVLEDLSQISIGFEDGSVMLMESSNILRDRQIKTTVICAPTGVSITNLIYRDDPNLTALYVITHSTTNIVYTHLKNRSMIKIDDAIGCAPNCAVLSDDSQNAQKLLFVCSSTIFSIDLEDRLACYVNNNNIVHASYFSNYLVIVSTSDSSASNSKSGSAMPSNAYTLRIYDLKAKLIIYHTRSSEIITCLSEWQSLLVILADGSVICLTDISLYAKIHILCKRTLFPVAQSLASSHSSDPAFLSQINRDYGDHLYQKGDYEGAVMQYVQTIGHVEPSFIIRKFLDAQRITNLASYIEHLHSKGFATPDHITLLLTCYTKLKQTGKLDHFVARSSMLRHSGSLIYDPDYISFVQRAYEIVFPSSIATVYAKHLNTSKNTYDVISAINSYRDCGYISHALFLSLVCGAHHVYLGLLLDENRFVECLTYIRSLPIHLAYFFLIVHGNVLLSKCRNDVVMLAIELCLGDFTPLQTTHTVQLRNHLASSSSWCPSVTVSIDSLGRNIIVNAIDSDGNNISSEPTETADVEEDSSSGLSSMSNILGFAISTTPNTVTNPVPNPAKDSDNDNILTLEDFDESPTSNTAFSNTSTSNSTISSSSSLAKYLPMLSMPLIAPHSLFHIFSSDRTAFIMFLEALAAYDIQKNLSLTHQSNAFPDVNSASQVDTKKIWNTLLECQLYIASGISENHSSLILSSEGTDGEGTIEELDVNSYTQSVTSTLYTLPPSLSHEPFTPANAIKIASVKVMCILRHHTNRIDVQHGIILLETYAFHEGLQCLYTKLGSSQEVLVLAMSHHEYKTIVDICLEYGEADHSLWVAALVYFTNLDPTSDPTIIDHVQLILRHLHKYNIISPYYALQLLSSNKLFTLESVKSFLTTLLTIQTNKVEADRVEAQRYLLDINSMTEDIADLSTKATIFKDVNCHKCKATLSVPSIHFLCLHSYHMHCVADATEMGLMDTHSDGNLDDGNNKECPSCVDEYKRAQQIQQNLKNSIKQHDDFMLKLDQADHGFNVIADYLGRGAFDIDVQEDE